MGTPKDTVPVGLKGKVKVIWCSYNCHTSTFHWIYDNKININVQTLFDLFVCCSIFVPLVEFHLLMHTQTKNGIYIILAGKS